MPEFTAAYTYNQFEQPIAQFSTSHSDYGLDNDNTDADNRYDFLALNVNLRIQEAGTYTVAAHVWYENLTSGKGQPIDWRSKTESLGVGDNTVQLLFDGYGIVKNQVEGKLYAEIVLFDENMKMLDMTMPAYETNNYSYGQFKETKTVNYGILANKPIPSVPAGQSTSVEIDDDDISVVSKVDITAGENLSGAKLNVTEHENPPPGSSAPSGEVMQYLDLSVYGSENVRNTKIHFKVSKSWVASENIDVDNLNLKHYNENLSMWLTLTTTLENEDADYYYFSAETDSFSWFVVIGQLTQEEEQQQGSGSQSEPIATQEAKFEFSVFEVPDNIKVGETATITFTITNSGNASGTYTAYLTLDGVILESREITLAAGASQEVSFEVVPTSTGTFVIQLAGSTASLVVNPEITVSQDLISVTAPEVYASVIYVDTPAVFDISETSITQIAVSVSAQVENVVLRVKELLGKPDQIQTDPQGTVYSYLEILAEKLPNENISEATVAFKVPVSWIENEGLDENTVALNRYNSGEWQSLVTEKTGGDENYLYFRATTPGFSLFAVSGSSAPATTPGGGPGVLPTQPLAGVPPLILVAIMAFILVVIIIAVIWRYLSLGAKGLTVPQKPRRR